MIIDLDLLHSIFGTDDGSLPEIEFYNLRENEVVSAYRSIRDHSNAISSRKPNFWHVTKDKEVVISIKDNPAELVVTETAEPFHLCFSGLKSPSGNNIPELGVFVFKESIALDYRMGPQWNNEAIEGLFELIKFVFNDFCDVQILHKSNENDVDGKLLEKQIALYLSY